MLQFHSFENGPDMDKSIFLQILELRMKERNNQTNKEGKKDSQNLTKARRFYNESLSSNVLCLNEFVTFYTFSYQLEMSSVVGVWRAVGNVCVSCTGNEGMVHSSSTLQDTATRCRYVINAILSWSLIAFPRKILSPFSKCQLWIPTL